MEYLRLVAGGSANGSANLGDTQLILIRAGVVAVVIVVVFIVFKRR